MKAEKRLFAVALLALSAVLMVMISAVWGRYYWKAEGVFADEAIETGSGSAEDDSTEGDSTEGDSSGDDSSVNEGSGAVSSESENVKIGAAFGDFICDVDGLEGDFILTYEFYNKSNGTDNWDNFVVEIRNEDYVWFDLRADNYGWLWYPSLGFVTGDDANITYGDGASDWSVWAELMREGQDCKVYIIRQSTKVTVITQAAGDTFYAIVYISEYDEDCALYAHLTGESCKIENATYSVQYFGDMDDATYNKTLAWIEETKALAASNNEGGVSYDSIDPIDGTTLESTEWWSGVTGVELSSDSNNTTWTYTIQVLSTVSDFGIEIYNGDATKYITTLTNGEGWYAGTTGEDLVISGESISDELERGSIYYVTVQRQGDDFTVFYTDSSGELLLAFFATDTDMDDTAYVHFYAEYGEFIVAASVDIGDPIDENADNTSDTEDNGSTDTEDTEDDDEPVTEDTEDVDENNHDDDDEDDDYDIEDLDDEEDTEDAEDTEEDSDILVTIEETTYSSQAWWSGAYGSETAWVGDAVWVYAVTVDKTYGDDVFSIEVYDADGNYITLNSDGTCWYYGTTGEDIEVSGNPIVLEEGMTYIVVVIRQDSDVWVVFYDEDGNELLSYYAADVSLDDTVASHFYAQIGDYTVSGESSGSQEAESESESTSGGIDEKNGGGSGDADNSNGGSSASSPKTGDVRSWWIVSAALVGFIIAAEAVRRMRRRSA